MIDERECCGTFKGTPHRKTCAKFRGYTQADIEAAVLAERERCMKVCDDLYKHDRKESGYDEGWNDALDIAEQAIRSMK